jgi:pimeloyl-[acyl-carrier protein] synthase
MQVDLRAEMRDPAFLADPYPTYARLREESPVARLEQENYTAWLILRYDDVDAVFRDSRVWKDWTRMHAGEEGAPAQPSQESMLFRDPPDHTRLRALMNRAFVPVVVRELAPRIQTIVTALADDLEAAGEADFMSAFARPLPVTVIAELLGVPLADQGDLRRWSDAVIRAGDGPGSSQAEVDAAESAIRALHDYFDRLSALRRGDLRDDLLSRLIAAEEAGDRLSHDELVETCILLLIAGHETTMNLLGNGLVALLSAPGEIERLRQDPGLAESAVEEMLRYDAPVQFSTFRFAGEAIELRGQRIARNDHVTCMIGSANRDPAAFSEPDRFDVARSPNRHQAFGRGIHFCLGAPLARLEAALAVRELTSRFDLSLGAPERRSTMAFRGFERLPVTARARAGARPV